MIINKIKNILAHVNIDEPKKQPYVAWKETDTKEYNQVSTFVEMGSGIETKSTVRWQGLWQNVKESDC